MKINHCKINKITYHYLTDCGSVSTNPCLNVFYKGKRGRRMVAMINPEWSDIRFITEREYNASSYKPGYLLENLSDIPREAIRC